MKDKKVIIIIFFLIIAFFMCYLIYLNSGLKGFEKKVYKIAFPEIVEKIALKSGVGDSGGNGNYSTYRVVLVVKTEMSIEQLNKYLKNIDITNFYITYCENNIFESQRNFKLVFEELEKIKNFSNYYFIEFVK